MKKVSIILHREEAHKIQKNKNILDKSLTLLEGVGNLLFMPSDHSPDKISVGAWIPRTLYARFKKEALARKMSVTEFFEFILSKAVKDVTLTPEDYEQIAQETRRAIERKSGKRTSSKSKSKS